MATKYARTVGGNWNTDATWSLSSGGAANTTVPGSSDNVVFDSNSGNVTVDVAINVNKLDVGTSTTYSGTLDFGSGYTHSFAEWLYVISGTLSLNNCTIQSQYIEFDDTGDLTISTNTATIKVLSGATYQTLYINYTTGGSFNFNGASIEFPAGTTGRIYGPESLTMNNLTFTAPLTISLFGIYTFVGLTPSAFIAVGSSGNLITISGGKIIKSSGVVSCDYLSLTNFISSGGAGFYAGNHSVDNGGNTGWIFRKPYSHIRVKSTDPDKLSFTIRETEIGELDAS